MNDHAHHWVMPPAAGATVEARCIGCGETRVFNTVAKQLSYNDYLAAKFAMARKGKGTYLPNPHINNLYQLNPTKKRFINSTWFGDV